jgi:hypothetical protein
MLAMRTRVCSASALSRAMDAAFFAVSASISWQPARLSLACISLCGLSS